MRPRAHAVEAARRRCSRRTSALRRTRDRADDRAIAADHAPTPSEPCLDGGPGNEDHPAAVRAENGYLGGLDAREAACWFVLAGACGHH